MEVERRNILPKNKLAIIRQGSDGQTEYTCIECSVKYVDKEKLEVHLCTHYKDYRFLCGICGTGLKRKEHLDRHTLGHMEVRPHVCPECGKGFKRKEHLNIHLSIHSGFKSQVCPLCQRSFYRKDHLQKHLQTHNKLFMGQNIFPLSDQELMDVKEEPMDDEDTKPIVTSGDELNCHVIMEVGAEDEMKIKPFGLTISNPPVDPERPYACCICSKTYKRRDHLKLHSLTHTKKDKVCTECGKAFHKEHHLQEHMNVHRDKISHDPEEMDFAPIESLLVERKGIPILPIEPHLLPRARSQAESRPHECPVCRRKFKRKQHLKVHANVHLKQHQHIIWCSICNEGFQDNADFENHQCTPSNQHNSDKYAGEYIQPLEYVEETSQGIIYDDAPARHPHEKKENNYPNNLVEIIDEETYDLPIPIAGGEHILPMAADEQGIPTPVRVYVCKYCSKPFKRKDHFRIHQHIHTGVKSFYCPQCGKGFYRKDHLQKHELVHLKEKPKTKKEIPDLYPIHMLPTTKEQPAEQVKPEITITAPSNTKLRVPLQIKVPYQVVMSMDNGEQRAVTIVPQAGGSRPRNLELVS